MAIIFARRTISDLPNEVLLLILEEALEQQRCTEYRRDYRVLVDASLVCKRWSVMASSPSLWTQVCFSPESPGQAEACLRRSQKCLLDIVVDYGYTYKNSTIDDWRKSPLVPALQHIKRWRSLRVFARQLLMRGIMHSIERAHAPNLQSVHLAQCEYKRSVLDSHFLQGIFLGGAPSLTSLRLFGGVPLRPDTLALRGITMLHMVRALQDASEWDGFAETITASPALEHLAVSFGEDGLVPGRRYTILDLPSLRSLSLNFSWSVHSPYICALLNVPAVHSLELAGIADWRVLMLALGLDSPSPRFPAVTLLTLRGVHASSSPRDTRFFASLPNVEELVLEDAVADTLLEALGYAWVRAGTGEITVPWPGLRTIRVCGVQSDDWTAQALGELVVARRDLGFPVAVM